jgi:hypothetical protein
MDADDWWAYPQQFETIGFLNKIKKYYVERKAIG